MRILVVDDNEDDRRLLRYMVEKNGHQSIEAENGAVALEKARAAAPDAIISDALMPVMDGFQFLREVRQDPAAHAVPFIVYSSAYQGCQDVRLAMSLGASGYFVKPMDPGDLWRQIEALLAARRRRQLPPAPLVDEDAQYLKQYSVVVATKLEEKVAELERTLEERKRAEEALRRSEEHLRRVYENLPVAYQSLDGEGRYIEVNPAWCRLTGHASGEVIGRLFTDFLIPASAELFVERFPRFNEEGEFHGVEYGLLRRDGSSLAVELSGKIVYEAPGRVKQAHCTLHEITTRSPAERTAVHSSPAAPCS